MVCVSWQIDVFHDDRLKFTIGRFGCQCDETPRHVLFDCPFVDSERLKIKNECSDGNIEFNLQKLMTHSSLQMPVERLLLSFLVSRDWYTHTSSQFPGTMIPTIRSLLGPLPQAFLSQYLRSILPPWQCHGLDGPRAPLTLHCEFKLGRNICAQLQLTHFYHFINFIFHNYLFFLLALAHTLSVHVIYSLYKGLYWVFKKFRIYFLCTRKIIWTTYQFWLLSTLSW